MFAELCKSPVIFNLLRAPAAAGTSSAQASDERGRPVWTVHQVPHRDLTAQTEFVALFSGNGTTLTLSAGHMVYVADAEGSTSRTPVAARDVPVR